MIMKLVIITVLCFALFLAAACHAGCPNQPALKDVFAKDFLIGAALNYDQILGKDASETALIETQFNSITPENILKWSLVHPEPDKYDFEAADRLVALGEKNGMFIVGHTLVWHYQTPNWVFQNPDGGDTDRETLLTRMKDHISTVVGRYKGRIHGWDVVNEAITPDGQFRKNKWLKIIGEDYVAKAFEFAHEADPDAQLYYNDFNMYRRGQVKGVIRLVKDLKERGLRVDGIGIQGHWGLDFPPNDRLEAAINELSQLGIKLMITELDLTVLPVASRYRGADISKNFEAQKKLNPYTDGLPGDMQQKLADRYAELFSFFHKHRDKFSRITFWGVHDAHSWRNNWPIRGRTDYPLLFDRHCQPKPAFDAVIKVVQTDK